MAKKTYKWNGKDGHSVSFATHLQRLSAKKATRQADANPLYDPTRQLSGSALQGAARDLTNLEFDPQRAALAKSLSDTTTQGTALTQRAGDYWGALAGIDAGIAPQQQAIAQSLKGAIDTNATDASAGIQAGVDAATKRAEADAAVRGSLGGSTAQGAVTEGAAQLGRVAEQRQAASDNAASGNAGWQNLANLASTARRQQGGEVQRDLMTRLANAQAGIRTQQTDLAGQEGAATSKNTTTLRQQAYENLITQAGLNIKSADIRSQERIANARTQASTDQATLDRQSREKIARDNRAARSAADKAARDGKASTINPYGYSNAQWLSMSVKDRQTAISDFNKQKTQDTTRPKAPGDVAMTAPAQANFNKIQNAVADIRTDPKLARHVHESGPRLTQILVKRGLEPLYAQAAAELARYKKLKPSTQQALQRAGMVLPADWVAQARNLGAGTGNPAGAGGTGLG